jgi:hypothetical protein
MNSQDILRNLGISLDIELDNSETYDYEIAGFDGDYDKKVIDFTNTISFNVGVENSLNGHTTQKICIDLCEIDNTPNDPNYIYSGITQSISFEEFTDHFDIKDSDGNILHDYQNFILNNDVFTYTGYEGEVHYFKICGFSDCLTPTSTPEPTSTELPTATPQPTQTSQPTPEPTSTELPTATPEPTLDVTGTPTPTPLNILNGLVDSFNDGMASELTIDGSQSYQDLNDYICNNSIVRTDYNTNIITSGNRFGTPQIGDLLTNRVGGTPYSNGTLFHFNSSGLEFDNPTKYRLITTDVNGYVISVDVLSVCTTPTPTSTPNPTATEQPTQTPNPTATEQPTPTPTVEPTGTPVPNPTPTLTPSPSSSQNIQLNITNNLPTNIHNTSLNEIYYGGILYNSGIFPIPGNGGSGSLYGLTHVNGTQGLQMNFHFQSQGTVPKYVYIYVDGNLDIVGTTAFDIASITIGSTYPLSDNSVIDVHVYDQQLTPTPTESGTPTPTPVPTSTETPTPTSTQVINSITLAYNYSLGMGALSFSGMTTTELGDVTCRSLSANYQTQTYYGTLGLGTQFTNVNNGDSNQYWVTNQYYGTNQGPLWVVGSTEYIIETDSNGIVVRYESFTVQCSPTPTPTSTPAPTPTPTLDSNLQLNVVFCGYDVNGGTQYNFKDDVDGTNACIVHTSYSQGITNGYCASTGPVYSSTGTVQVVGSELTTLTYSPNWYTGLQIYTGYAIIYPIVGGVDDKQNGQVVHMTNSIVDEVVTCVTPTPTEPPTPTPNPTSTPQPTPNPTATEAPTATPIPTATEQPTPVPTSTETPTPTPQAWSPSNSITPVAWIDPSDTSSWSRFGSILASVTDKAGTYTMTVGGSPTTSSTQNGLSVFDFSGSNDFLQSTTYESQVSGGNHFALGVFRYESTNNDKNSLWSYETNSSPKRDYAISSGASNGTWPGELDMDGLSTGRISSTIGNLQTWNLKSLTQNQYHIVSCWFNKTGNQIGVRVDGQNAFTPVNDYDNSIQTNQELRLMRNRASVELDGKMGEFIAYASMPGTSGTDMSHLERAEGYLAHKWGLTGSLPSSHPYKNTAPTL